MPARKSRIAKITPPQTCGIFQRERVFRLLDEGRLSSVEWVAGPAGSGKTTLAASYLESRRLPCLWYQIDEGDGDLASFFYYLGLAAKTISPRSRKPLPLLTPSIYRVSRFLRDGSGNFADTSFFMFIAR
jgi:ATP/maltotriose-dependent transcriptional regulator MalT